MRKALLIFFCIFLLSAYSSAAGDQITSLKQEMIVNADGEISITVTANVSFSDSPNRFVFPLGTDADDITASGASYTIETIDGVECAVFTEAGAFMGERTFMCAYTLPCAVFNNEEGQMFSVDIIEKGWSYPIASLSLHMQFPTEITAYPLWSSAYYGDVIDNYLNIQISEERTIDVSSTTALKDHEQLSMTLQFPADTFELYHLRGTTVSIFRTVFYILSALSLLYWFFTLRGEPLLPKKQNTVGMEATAGELACQLYGTEPDIAATLAHWGNLGYLTIHRTRRGRILLQKQMDMGNERKFSERRLFDKIFKNGDTVDATTERFRQRAAESAGSLQQGWQQRLFVSNGGSPKLLRWTMLLASFALNLMLFDLWVAEISIRWLLIPILAAGSTFLCDQFRLGIPEILRRRYLRVTLSAASAGLLLLFAAFAGCTGLMLWNLLLHAFFALFTVFGKRRTPEGNDTVRELLGLRHFLRTADMDTLLNALAADGQYFYRTLPFAELLGVGAVFSKHCKHLPMELCPWLSDARREPKNALVFYHIYSDIVSAIRADANSVLFRLLDPSSHPQPEKRARRTKTASRPHATRSRRPSGRPRQTTGRARRPRR